MLSGNVFSVCHVLVLHRERWPVCKEQYISNILAVFDLGLLACSPGGASNQWLIKLDAAFFKKNYAEVEYC